MYVNDRVGTTPIGVRLPNHLIQAIDATVVTIPGLRRNKVINIAVAEFVEHGGLQRIGTA